jgi:hypothetical protein
VVLTVAIVAFIVGAMWKPWAPPPQGRPLVQGPIPTAATETASGSGDPLGELREECNEPGGWRVYSHEGFLDQDVRVWRSVEPVAIASGPLDPSLPLIQVGPVNEALGYCAPWTGPERPPDGSIVSAWQVLPGTRRLGTAGTEAAVPVRLARVLPTRATVLGALYAGPGGRPGPLDGRAAGWATGRYVFAVRAPGWERWWGVEVSTAGPFPSEPSSGP